MLRNIHTYLLLTARTLWARFSARSFRSLHFSFIGDVNILNLSVDLIGSFRDGHASHLKRRFDDVGSVQGNIRMKNRLIEQCSLMFFEKTTYKWNHFRWNVLSIFVHAQGTVSPFVRWSTISWDHNTRVYYEPCVKIYHWQPLKSYRPLKFIGTCHDMYKMYKYDLKLPVPTLRNATYNMIIFALIKSPPTMTSIRRSIIVNVPLLRGLRSSAVDNGALPKLF